MSSAQEWRANIARYHPSLRVTESVPTRCCALVIPAGAIVAAYDRPSPNRVWVIVQEWPDGAPSPETGGDACAVMAQSDGTSVLRVIGTLHKLKASTLRRVTASR